jgi:hypothetical protein
VVGGLLDRARPDTAGEIGFRPLLAGDDPGDHLHDLGQRPLQGAGEAIAFGERSGG